MGSPGRSVCRGLELSVDSICRSPDGLNASMFIIDCVQILNHLKDLIYFNNHDFRTFHGLCHVNHRMIQSCRHLTSENDPKIRINPKKLIFIISDP